MGGGVFLKVQRHTPGLTKIIPNCSLIDPPIIDLQLGLMETAKPVSYQYCLEL